MGIFKFLKSKGKKPKIKEKLEESETEVIKVSDEIQLTVKGLPANLTLEQRQEICHSLVRNTLSRLPEREYNQGENIYQGKAHLRINDELHEVIFSLDAIRIMTALKIYKDAFDNVKAGAREGIYDLDLAGIAADYIKQSAWDEVQSFQKHQEQHQREHHKIERAE